MCEPIKINMLVSHSHKFIFIKTRKTAGTSVECLLEQFCRPSGYIITVETDMAETEYGIVGARGFDASESFLPKWYHHMTSAEIKDKLSDDIWNQYYKITNIRNPFDQTVSWFWHYNYMKRVDLLTKPFELIKEQFKNFILSKNRPNSNKKLLGLGFQNAIEIDNKSVIDIYIRYENLQNDVKDLFDKLKVSSECILPNKKCNIRKIREPYQSYYDSETKEIVYNAFKWEIENFGYTF